MDSGDARTVPAKSTDALLGQQPPASQTIVRFDLEDSTSTKRKRVSRPRLLTSLRVCMGCEPAEGNSAPGKQLREIARRSSEAFGFDAQLLQHRHEDSLLNLNTRSH